MSRLRELITELCPDGVPVVSIGSLIKRERQHGKDDSTIKQVYAVSNTMGIVRAEDMRENTVHSEDTSNYTIIRRGMIAYNPSRLNIGSIARLKEDEPGLVSPMYVVFSLDKDKIAQEYFDYLLKSSYVLNKIDSLKEEGARFRFDFDRWKWIDICLPPLPIQLEIVKILDCFTQLISYLSIELAERTKQYDYYRDYLFGDELYDFKEFTVQELIDSGMICEPMDGNHGDLHPKKTDYTETGIPFIMANDLSYGTVDYKNCHFISEKQASSLRKGFAKPGDVLITHKGTIGRTAIVPEGYDYIVLTPQVTYYRILKGINSNYLRHYFNSSVFQKQISSFSSLGGTRAYVGITAQHSLTIRLPDLSIQEKISSILDQFEMLNNSNAIGLPAEISARQKQFEYYRDELLSFRKKS